MQTEESDNFFTPKQLKLIDNNDKFNKHKQHRFEATKLRSNFAGRFVNKSRHANRRMR